MSKTSPENKPAGTGLPDTIPRMVLSGNERYQNHPVCRVKRGDAYHDITWTDFAKELHAHIRGLLANGFNRGDRAAIMAPNGPDWAWADIAIQACGGVSVPVYHTESMANTLYMLNNSASPASCTSSVLLFSLAIS